jgi:hypothetical protein
MRVVLPDPFGPMRAIKSPRERTKETPRSTSRPWKPKETFSTKIRGSFPSIVYPIDLLGWLQGIFREHMKPTTEIAEEKRKDGRKGHNGILEYWNIEMVE